jgi:thioredoxin reductase
LSTYEVVIVGAGVAGLAAASLLGRSARTVAVVGLPDRGNAGAAAVQNLPYAEGIAPEELYARMEQAVGAFAIPMFRETVETVSVNEPLGVVEIRTAARSITASRLLLANGVEYVLPPWVPVGAWGKTVFDCPFCHAYEHRGEDFVVVGPRQMTVDVALLCMAQARTLTVVVADRAAASSAAANKVRELGGEVITNTIETARVADSSNIELTTLNGRRLAAGAVVLSGATRMRPRFVQQLGLETNKFGIPETDADGMTSHRLVWTAGTAAQPQYGLAEAMGSGIRAAIAIHKNLALEGLY